ncbi:MAG: large subunit ribosomal protein L24 [Pseudohongiellaceae bacterium]|jgi:large subunit ribosomal protein L24
MAEILMGDTVIVNAGAQRGETGRVIKLDRKHGKAVVEGINMKWKHMRRSQEQPQGGRSQREYPVDLSNLSFYDAETGNGVRLGSAVVDGKKVRVMRPSGKTIDG